MRKDIQDDIDEKSKRRRDFIKVYKTVRKKMPPPEEIIKPKNEFERERFDWRKALEEDEDINKGDNTENE